jgi:uncharacterized CHY-type Zn-finger protein
MIKKNSSERIVCAKCRERLAIKGFSTVPVCNTCSQSEESNLTTLASTGAAHAGTESLHQKGS